MDAVIARRNRRASTVKIYVHVGMEPIIARGHAGYAAIDIKTIIRRNTFSLAVYGNERCRGRIRNQDVVVSLDAIIACVNVELTASNNHNSLFFRDYTIVVALVALDSIAICCRQFKITALNIYRALALDSVIFGLDRNFGQITNAQIVAAMNSVVVVSGYGQRAATLNRQVILGIDSRICRVAGTVRLCIRFRAGRSIFKSILCPIHQQ